MEEQLVKYFSGNLSPEEVRKIETWRRESDENASEFLECHRAWKLAQVPKENTGSALRAVMSKIDAKEETVNRAQHKSFLVYLKYAAIAVFAIGVAFGAIALVGGQPDQETVVAKENLEIIALPDGSVVTLSSHATLTYASAFDDKTRQVTLSGKAFFDIKRDESRPFIVETDQSKIEVLGTSFLVNTAGVNASTEVVVKTGRVAVSKRERGERNAVELVAGEVGRLRAEAPVFEKSNLEDLNYLAWKTKLMEFRKVNLKSVITTISDVYQVKITVSDENIYNCLMSAKFDQQPVEAVLEILSRTFDMQLSKVAENEYHLSGKGCIVLH
ncbi:FecR domain-containing protein [Reichenbachiella carrageenanivorans]|uniref:FecR domain-containing protein n=1 Tax=Reichenbachiella carrageenanivorans TaxID=2979869 RepID=A0ABY6D648_9BACT|nr:FecR domain-containing protein [Reichenbachiella carrageenanivorans]UXX79325.1 FecR domain-containing protein [Reichenbachiella carrageenanivorans]